MKAHARARARARHGAEYLEPRSISAFLTMLRLFSVGDCKPKLQLGCPSKSKQSEFNRAFRSDSESQTRPRTFFMLHLIVIRPTWHVPTRCARATCIIYRHVHASCVFPMSLGTCSWKEKGNVRFALPNATRSFGTTANKRPEFTFEHDAKTRVLHYVLHRVSLVYDFVMHSSTEKNASFPIVRIISRTFLVPFAE